MQALDQLRDKLAGLRRKKAGATPPAGPKVCGVLVGQRSLHVYSGKLEDALSGAARAREFPVEDGKLAATLAQLLEQGELGQRVVLGLDPTLDFLSTARADDGNQIQAQSQLADRLAGRLPGGVASRENPAGTNKVKLKSLLFFPRRIGLSILEGLSGLGRSRLQILSTTHVLDALARKRKASPRKWKVEIRVLVAEPESVALLCFRGVPVARQTVPTQGEAKVAALSSVIQRMASAAQGELNLGELNGIVLHCPAAELPEIQASCGTLQVPMVQAPDFPVDRSALAALLAAARGGARRGPLELGSVLHVAGERPLFPLKPALPAAAALLAGAAHLWSQGSAVLAEVEEMEAAIDGLVVEREITRDDIVDLRDGMGIEVGAAEAFLVQRVYWSKVLLELVDATPDGCWLAEVEGDYRYQFTPKLVGEEDSEEGAAEPLTRRKRYLKLAAYLPSYDGQLGDEGERMSNAIDFAPNLDRAFPHLGNVNYGAQEQDGESYFLFSVEAGPPGG